MTAALLIGAGAVIGMFVVLHAATLLDRLTLASTFEPDSAERRHPCTSD